MPTVAVVNHAVLNGLRRGVGRGRWRGLGGRSADDAGADVVFSPDSSAGSTTDLRIPGCELSDGDAVLGSDGGAGVAGHHLVEAVAVVYHAWLGRIRSCDTISWCSWRWSSSRRLRGRSRRCRRSWRLREAGSRLNAIRVVHFPVPARLDGRILR